MIQRQLNPHKNRTRRGMVSVELAIMAPLLFMFLLASIEFGRMNTLRHTVSSAAYEAARCGIVMCGNRTQCENRANAVMQTIGAKDVQIEIVPSVIDRKTPKLTVTVSVPTNSNGYLAPLFFQNQQLVGTCTLTRDVVPN